MLSRLVSFGVLAILLMILNEACAGQLLDFAFDPKSVDIDTRDDWCKTAIATCSTLCSQYTELNDCTKESLIFHCKCKYYDTPDPVDYTATIPTFKCQNLNDRCVALHSDPGDETDLASCKSEIEDNCGILDPADYKAPDFTRTGTYVV